MTMRRAYLTLSCGLLGLAVLAAPARAAVAPSRGRLLTERDHRVERVRRLLYQERVRERLESLGMDRDEIDSRLDEMDDVELDLLADRLDSLAVGRSAVGVVVAVLVIVALVLLIVWLVDRV
jgi:hypothetical protein